MRIRHFQGEGYTLTLIRIPKNRRNKGISRSTIEVRDLAGKVFDVWKYEGGEWLNPVHGIAKSVTQKEIYDAIDINDYAKKQ